MAEKYNKMAENSEVCSLMVPGELMVVAARWHQQVVVSEWPTRVPVHAPWIILS